MFSVNDFHTQIHKNGYSHIPFSVSHVQFQEAIETFFNFLALPYETKKLFYFKIRPDDRGSEVGYNRYRREEGKTDNREYFHYHPLAREHFKEGINKEPTLRKLIDVMEIIYDEASRTLLEVMSSFEKEYPGITGKYFSKETHSNFYLRFLKYDVDTPGAFLAKGHYDRGSCTLALSESAPGLRLGYSDTDLREVEHTSNEAIFMPGLTFHEVTSEKFSPIWHDVLQKSTDTYNEDTARWAVVFFADTLEISPITYEEAHTPIARN